VKRDNSLRAAFAYACSMAIGEVSEQTEKESGLHISNFGFKFPRNPDILGELHILFVDVDVWNGGDITRGHLIQTSYTATMLQDAPILSLTPRDYIAYLRTWFLTKNAAYMQQMQQALVSNNCAACRKKPLERYSDGTMSAYCYGCNASSFSMLCLAKA
jgi:hypothetical protein